MFTSVRSVRATIGRMPTAAQASMSGLTGKQKRYSVPSSLRMRAIMAATVIWLFSLGSPLLVERKARPAPQVHTPGVSAEVRVEEHVAGAWGQLDRGAERRPV